MLTSGWIRVCIMQLEGDPFDEVGEIVGSSDYFWIWRRCSTSDCDSPAMCMVWRRQQLSFFLGQDNGSVAIDDWPVDVKTLYSPNGLFSVF